MLIAKRFRMLGALAVGLLVLGGCGFRVVFPVAMQVDSQDFELTTDDKIQITVRFSAAVDMTTLEAATNVILETERDTNADIIITAGADATTIVITTVADYPLLCDFDPDCFFSLRLLGTTDPAIRDTEGNALTNYETGFVILG
jgi:hypothetical protein